MRAKRADTQTLTPQAARDLIRERATAAVQRIAEFKPRKLNGALIRRSAAYAPDLLRAIGPEPV